MSGTHANPLGIKTDAPPDVLWDIMRCWVAQHPNKRPPDPESHTGLPLCAVAACMTLHLASARRICNLHKMYSAQGCQQGGLDPAETYKSPLVLLSGRGVPQYASLQEARYADPPRCMQLSCGTASPSAAAPVLRLTAAHGTAGRLLSKVPKIQADFSRPNGVQRSQRGPKVCVILQSSD